MISDPIESSGSVHPRGKRRIFEAGELSHIVLLGAGELAAVAAEFSQENHIQLSVFMGHRQAGFRMAIDTDLTSYLGDHGARVKITESIRNLDDGPFDIPPDGALVFSVGSPFIISQELIDWYGERVFNTHGAPLPEWRGGGGFSWRIFSGDRRGRTCFHHVTPGIDDGDIVFSDDYQFPSEVRLPVDYQSYANARASDVDISFLADLLGGTELEFCPQDESNATYFPRLHADTQAAINWSWQGEEIERFILAFSHPYPGAWTFVKASKARIFDCHFVPDTNHQHPFFNGQIFRFHNGKYYVCCDGGTLIVDESNLVVEEPISIGDRLNTPDSYISAALQIRPKYTPVGVTKASLTPTKSV